MSNESNEKAHALMLAEALMRISNGRLLESAELFLASAAIELQSQHFRIEELEDALDVVNLDRLGKALTKLGHAGWVSQEEAAADMPRWVNALTSCVLEIPEASPQPQADSQDAAWSDLKIAFDIPDGEDETLWKCVESGAITLPNGWKLIETTGAGVLVQSQSFAPNTCQPAVKHLS